MNMFILIREGMTHQVLALRQQARMAEHEQVEFIAFYVRREALAPIKVSTIEHW